MRFVSHSPGLMIAVLDEKVRFTEYGDRIVDREGYVVRFNQNDLNEGDLEFAMSVWPPETLRGGQVQIDEVTPVPFMYRLSVFDTDEEAKREKWEGQTLEDHTGVYDKKEYIERFMSEKSIGHTEFRQIVEIKLVPPWPNYLDYQGSEEQLLARVRMDGHDLRQVLRYEMQLNERPAMIELLQAEINKEVLETQGAEVVPA